MYINYKKLEETSLNHNPFKYFIIEDFIKNDYVKSLETAFPKINTTGSMPLASLKYNEIFENFVEELKGDKFREIISNKFSMDLSQKPLMISARGMCKKITEKYM